MADTIPAESVEEIIEQHVNRLSWSQIIQTVLVALSSIFDGQQTFIDAFTDAEPKWHCVGSDNAQRCSPSSKLCNLPRSAWAWDEDRGTGHHATIISEWGIECASFFITSLPATCFFIGTVLGGVVLSLLGDSSLGRKKLLYFSCLFMSVAALVSSFSVNIWMYSACRLLTGLGRASINTTALILLTERVGKRWRNQLSMIALFCYSFGMLSLSGFAYISRHNSWREIYLWTSVPGILYSVFAYPLVVDSPRWLLMKGREAEAMAVLEKIGNSRSSTTSTVRLADQQEFSSRPYQMIKLLLKTRWNRIIPATALSFGIGMMYFGMFLASGSLPGFNIYLTTTYNGLVSLLSYPITFLVLLKNCDRKPSLLAFCLIGGASSLACSFIKHDYKALLLALELIAYFCACMAYDVLQMFVIEMFPTCIRSFAASLIRLGVIMGSVFDPMLVAAGRKKIFMSYGVFGVVMIVCGITVLCLPETRGKNMCDTMEEQ